MFYITKTHTFAHLPTDVAEKVAAFRSESMQTAMRAAESFHAETKVHFDVEERRTVHTTQTIDEAIAGPDLEAGGFQLKTDSHVSRYSSGAVRVGDHTPEPFVGFHKDRV